jgi:hypothetical protein
MNDDRFLRDLARAAREEREREVDHLDERWDRLAAGTLSAEEEAELRALAATSEEARLAYEAFRPLGPQFEGRVVEAIQEQAEAEAVAAREAPPPARVLPFRRWSGWLAGAVAAGLAACLALFLAAPEPLPLYSRLAVAGGDQPMRGAANGPATVRVLHPGSALEVTLSPPTQVSGRVEARWFVVRGTEVHELGGRVEISSTGSAHFVGTLGEDLEIGSGEWALWCVVGRPRKLPDPKVLSADSAADSLHGSGWTARRAKVPLQIEASR